MCLQEMPTGGRTPLSRGLYLALDVIETERMKDRNVLPLIVLLSDGRANVAMGGAGGDGRPASKPLDEAKAVAALVQQQHIPAAVVDTEVDFIRLGLAKPIAEAMGAHYLMLEDLQAGNLADAVRLQLPTPDAPPLTQDEIQGLLDKLALS
jgi:magnesium chelatase subunit D